MPRVVLLVLFALLLTACNTEPDYPVERLRFEPALIGKWEPISDDPDDHDGADHTLEIRAREVGVRDGRVASKSSSTHGFSETPRRDCTTAYRITFNEPDSSIEALECDAYLVTIAGRDFLGLQVSANQLVKSGGPLFVLPIHRLYPVRLEGDTLTIAFAANIAWVPGVAWLEGDPSDPRKPGEWFLEDTDEPRPLAITSTIDRLLAEYDAAPGADAFEFSDSATYKRAAE
jgi:hypothetical protein